MVHLHIEHTEQSGRVVRSGAFQGDSPAHQWLLANWRYMNPSCLKHEIVECNDHFCECTASAN